MDWQEDEIAAMLKELNPELAHTPVEVDSNWQKLQIESNQLRHTSNCIKKTQTPTLYDFDKEWYGFSYRGHDGAQWTTYTRNLFANTRGLTSQQKELKDCLDTVLNLTGIDIKPKWYTPVDNQTVDPHYQLIKSGLEWWCVIGDSVYAQSSSRQIRSHTEIRFSTKVEPVFTLESLNNTLDHLIKP